MSSDYTVADDEVQGQHADKDADRQERVKAKNRRAQKRYREKKLQETDQYKLQIKELNARLRQMAEDKRTVQKDRDRLERIVKSTAESSTKSSVPEESQSRPQKHAGMKDVLEAFPFLRAQPQEQIQQYRERVAKFRDLFMQGGDREGSPEQQQILAMITESRKVQEVLMQMFPFTAARLKSDIQRAAFTDVGMHTPTHWQRVVEAARLSQPQRARLLSLRAALLQDIDRITCERKAIMGGIKEMLPHPAVDTAFGSMLFKAQLSTSRLRANLEEEYQVIINFISKALIETLTPLQHARCMVAASPFLPDVMYVCSVVYLQDRGLPLGHLDLLPDMESLRSDISVHGWVSGDQDNLATRDGMWPMVYQGLGVYKEPVQRHTALAAPHHFGALPGDATALSPLPSLDSPPYAQLHADTGGSGSSPDSGQPLPPDAIAALLAIDSLPLPEELDPGLTTNQPYMGSYL
ncbi:g2895 [Coccomyxa viridis]|uniref:G2895 protein n=1 Tax=Coccomyxa viridis TaxID=1274662 RepID=A0ABP1FQ29_9CHLO